MRCAVFATVVALGAAAAGCAAKGRPGSNDAGSDEGGSGGQGGQGGANPDAAGGSGGGRADAGGFPADDPTTCEEAAKVHSYVGCDYWPVTLANTINKLPPDQAAPYDFAVVVANAGADPADIVVTGGALTAPVKVSVPANQLEKVFLPYVDALKDAYPDSVHAKKGAYHLTSTRPVTVYQFNPLEYHAAGGPPGKDWGTCVADPKQNICLSYSNDASLLIPSTAMTGHYRITGQYTERQAPGYFAITAVEDGTDVTVTLGAKGQVFAGAGIPATAPGGTFTAKLAAGDVLHVDAGYPASDLSGSLVSASKPVQVIAGNTCTEIPSFDVPACDHIEETVLPRESLGKHYLVNVSTAPSGKPYGHVVRIYGDQDGTTLTYAPTTPPGAPAKLDAGAFVDLGIVDTDFEVKGDQPFAVATFMVGGTRIDPKGGLGDPSQSTYASVEQFRRKYVFLAPDDYDISFADVVAPDGTTLTLDGATVTAAPVSIGATGFQTFRIELGAGVGGAHVLLASRAVGLQVLGYGKNTSYQFPGGLNLTCINPKATAGGTCL